MYNRVRDSALVDGAVGEGHFAAKVEPDLPVTPLTPVVTCIVCVPFLIPPCFFLLFFKVVKLEDFAYPFPPVFATANIEDFFV